MRPATLPQSHEVDLTFVEEVQAGRPLREPYQEDSLLPRGALAWLPFLWQRVLFPGRAEAGPAPKWALWFFLLAPGILLYPCLTFHLFEPDEGRYAQIPREMLTAGNWLVPTLQGEPYLDKPPLFYWLVMGSFSLFGFYPWAARLAPALAVHATILLTYFFGRRLLGPRSAFWGALLLSLAPAFVGMGRLLILDGLLTLWVTGALFCAWRALEEARLHKGWWLAAAILSGLGILTKGPVALILLIPPLLAHRWLSRRPARIRWRDWILLVGLAVAVALPWYVAVCLARPDFIRHFLWEHNVLRFFQPFDHIRPVWFFVPIVLGGLLPAMLWLPSLLRYLGAGAETDQRHRCPALGFLLLAGCWCILFFSLSGSKLPTYILPAFPLLALALGHALVERGWASRSLTTAILITATILLAFVHFVAVPWYAKNKSPLNDPATVEKFCPPNVRVLCFPRNVDSVAFHLGRDDLHSFRGKYIHLLIDELQKQPQTVVLFAHRNSLETLTRNLPPQLHIVRTAPLGLCDMAEIERR